MSWEALLSGEQAARAREAVEQIATALADAPMEDFSLAGGSIGVALFFAEAEKARPGQGYKKLSEHFRNHAIAQLSVQEAEAGLYSGVTGVAFGVEMLLEGSVLEDDPNENIDEALESYLDQARWEADYDLIRGLVGLGVYALERPQRASAARILGQIVGHLEATAEIAPEGLCWRTSPEWMIERTAAEYPEGYYDLGVAHGVAGIIGLLAGIVRSKIQEDHVRGLLEGAVGWLLAQKGAPYTGDAGEKAGASHFAALRTKNKAGTSGRSAWCYGDPGVASVLWLAGEATNNAEWCAEAQRLALGASALSPEDALVRDSSLCHGSSGLMHIYNRMYQATGEPRFADAARRWADLCLSQLQPDEGVGGVVEFVGATEYQASPGLLSGAAGVGLALLAMCSQHPPGWDRALLLSGMPQSS